jgi:hypothetical protein
MNHEHEWVEMDPTEEPGLTYAEIRAYLMGMRQRCECGEYRGYPVR